jgi:CRP/FNR family transcriptional regulator, nitrogen fixation regulation protein
VRTAFHGGRKPLGRKRRRRSPVSSSRSPRQSFYLMGTPTSFSSNQKIFRKGEPGEYLYKVESGCIRTCDTLNDGHRWIDTFYLPGDFFGLEAREEHTISAEAITSSSVRVIKRKALVSRAARSIAVVEYLLNIAAMELQRTQNHNRLLLKGAQERVVDFLLEMKNRQQRQNEVDLPMTRLDIADYLGLTIETVSRVLTRLKRASAISLPTSRRVILGDLSVLN